MSGRGDGMEGGFEPEDLPLLVEWRGGPEGGHLLLKDGIGKFDVATRMALVLTMAGFGIGMALATLPKMDREMMSQGLLEDALRVANEVFGEEVDEEEAGR